MKNYLNIGTRKVIKVIANDDYSLTLQFDNGELRNYEMSEKLFGVFHILNDIEKFKPLFIDESGNIAWNKDNSIDSNVMWNNRIDISETPTPKGKGFLGTK